MREPVVCFSIALGTVGLMIPIVVPRFWGKYPDTIANDKRVAEAVKRHKEAQSSPSKFNTLYFCIHQF